MKKIKILLALAITLSLLVTVVAAEGLDLSFNVPNNEIELVDGSISLAAYLNMDIESKSSSLVVYYDANIWEISDVSSQAGTAGAKEVANNMANSTITATYTGAQSITKDDVFLSFTAKPKEGKEKDAIGSKFLTKPTLSTSNAGMLVKAKGYETITVKAPSAKTAVLTFEGVEGTRTVDENGKLVGAVPTLADKTEATFDGWAVKGTTDKVDFATATFTEDTTFEAIWKTKTFTVKFDTDGANETVVDQTVEYGKTVTDPGELTKDGYTFEGWDKDITTAITADTTFTAKWTKNHVAAECGTELSEVKAYTDGFYYEGRYFFVANDDVVAKYGVSIKGAKETKDFVGTKKVEGPAKVLYRIALLGDDEAALKAIEATPFINK